MLICISSDCVLYGFFDDFADVVNHELILKERRRLSYIGFWKLNKLSEVLDEEEEEGELKDCGDCIKVQLHTVLSACVCVGRRTSASSGLNAFRDLFPEIRVANVWVLMSASFLPFLRCYVHIFAHLPHPSRPLCASSSIARVFFVNFRALSTCLHNNYRPTEFLHAFNLFL